MKPDASDSVNEADLIARCRRGNTWAWDDLFDRHYDAVGRFVFQCSPDFTREDVEEICQETFLTVVRRIASFRGASAFQTWLFRIALNRTRDFRERRNAAKRGSGRSHFSLDSTNPPTGQSLDVQSPDPSPDDALAGREQMALLRQAIDRLNDPCREIIELRYFGDLSYEELASVLNLNPKTVSSRLSKCLDRLEGIARPLFERENLGPFPV